MAWDKTVENRNERLQRRSVDLCTAVLRLGGLEKLFLDKGHELSEHGPRGALRGSWLVKGTECFYSKCLIYSSIELKEKRT